MTADDDSGDGPVETVREGDYVTFEWMTGEEMEGEVVASSPEWVGVQRWEEKKATCQMYSVRRSNVEYHPEGRCPDGECWEP